MGPRSLVQRRHGEITINWEAIGAIGELVGAAAVVLTLAYVARQIRLSASQQRLESHRAMAELQIQTNRIFYDPSKARAVTSALNDWNRADEDSRILLNVWLIDTLTHYQTLFQMWQAGAVADDYYFAEENFLVKELLATNGGKVWWQECSFLWSETFVNRLEPLIASEPLGFFQGWAARLSVKEGELGEG